MKTIALGIPHTPWVPSRVDRMVELRRRLSYAEYPPASGQMSVWDEAVHGKLPRSHLVTVREFTERAPNKVWSVAMWRWALESGADFFLTLQDDSEVMPTGFWQALQAMLHVLPKGAALGLSAVHPEAIKVRAQGHRWYRTISWLVGWGYGLWREDLEAMLAFREELGAKADELNEDQFVNAFISAKGRCTWHPVPSIVDHDTSLDSHYGNDEHTCRRTVVRWDPYDPRELGAPEFWRLQGSAPPQLQTTVNPTLAKYDLIIGTPHQGSLHHAHVISVHKLMRIAGLRARKLEDLDGDVEVRWLQQGEDLVRARSRMVRTAVVNGGTHLLFADADNSFDPDVVLRMLASGKDFVQAPYRRRDGLGYSGRFSEKMRAIGRLDPADIEKDDTTRIEGTGFGLTLLSRACTERMLEHYGNEPLPHQLDALREEVGRSRSLQDALEVAYELGRKHGHRLAYNETDPGTGQVHRTIALFQLLIRDEHLFGEDRSFAQRWLDIGGEVWMYVGKGSPIAHHGDHAYRGTMSDFGLTRIDP